MDSWKFTSHQEKKTITKKKARSTTSDTLPKKLTSLIKRLENFFSEFLSFFKSDFITIWANFITIWANFSRYIAAYRGPTEVQRFPTPEPRRSCTSTEAPRSWQLPIGYKRVAYKCIVFMMYYMYVFEEKPKNNDDAIFPKLFIRFLIIPNSPH